MVGKDLWPAGIFRVWRFWDDPEALVGMVNESDSFLFGLGHWPGTSKEVEGVVVVDAALEMNGQVEVQQGC